MRTTIRLDDQLLAEAKAAAAYDKRSLTQLIEDALRESLSRRGSPARNSVELPTFAGSGLRPGVDIDSAAELLDMMDRHASA